MRTASSASSVVRYSHASDTDQWVYLPLIVALAMRFASGPAANLSYVVIAAYALLGPTHAIRALALSWLFALLNPGIAPEASVASIGRYAILFAAAFSALIHSELFSRNPRLHPFTVATVFLGLSLIGHSVLFSAIVDVSVLKAVSWMLAMVTLISAWSGLSDWQKHEVSRQIFWGLVVVLVVSLPVALLPAIGYRVNGTGFQGILNHPQAFGSTMALLGAWAASRLFGEPKPGWWLVGLAGGCVMLVLMSEARTAGLAMVGGVGLAVLLAPGFAGSSIMRMVPGLRSARIWVVLCMAIGGGLVMAPKIADMVDHYITKSGRAAGSDLSELYDRSRGKLIDTMLHNIARHPLTGIGFGIASEPALMEVDRDPVLGLPTGASIEKGVTPLMVLEETGIFGALLVTLWLLRLLRSAARSGLMPFAVCMTVLLLNMGEATLFSPGGFGLLPMVLLGWAYAGGLSRTRMRRA
ncbi:MAG: hypothetical protein ACTHLK_12555 [Brucella intermedia]